MKITSKLFVLALLLLNACSGKESKQEAVRPVFYSIAGQGQDERILSYPGVSRAANEIKLSFRLSGTTDYVAVEMGDTIKTGDVIARLDTTDYVISHKQATASLKSAEAQLASARSAYSRIENLYVNDNVSLSEYEKAKTNYGKI